MVPSPSKRQRASQLTVFLTLFFLVWSLRATVFFALDEQITSPTWRSAYSALLKFVLWVLPAAAFAAWWRMALPVQYLGLSVAPDARTWMICLAATAAFLLGVALVETSLGNKSLSTTAVLSIPVLSFFIQLLLSPLFEEILFRGLVMKELQVLFPNYLASTVTSLLFVGAHLPYWLSHGGVTQAMLVNAGGYSSSACWPAGCSREAHLSGPL
jgi:membrane protease YdiL (CAAX protease family)